MTMAGRAANARDIGPQVLPTTSLRVRKCYLLLAIGRNSLGRELQQARIEQSPMRHRLYLCLHY